MRVHSPLVGECDSSLIYMHWGHNEPSVGSSALQVGSPSDWCAGLLHSPLQLDTYPFQSACSVSVPLYKLL